MHEIKEQREEQHKILKEQKAIVDELKKHHELHVKLTETNETIQVAVKQKDAKIANANSSIVKRNIKQEITNPDLITTKSMKMLDQTSLPAKNSISSILRKGQQTNTNTAASAITL